MQFYHGSKNSFSTIAKKQASKAEHIDVPEKELLNAIYLTPDYGFALACAARPEGVTDIDDENKLITFEDPEKFDPEEKVFVYEIDLKNIPEKNIIKIDERQYAIVGVDELKVVKKNSHNAKDIEKFYELKNWKEKPREFRPEFRMR